MKGISLFFEVHQPLRLRRYRFFDISNDHYYYDDFTNENILRKVADACYLPANKLLLDLIKKHKGEFKVSFSITGVLLDQLETYAPEVIDSFRALAQTGNVEFLAETYSHSLACMGDKEEFVNQVEKHRRRIKDLFGTEALTFRNTELVYSDEIGSWVAELGFESILTEGAKHILGWRSPDHLYCNPINPKLKVLLRNFQLSDDIAFRFSNSGWSEWPLTTEKFAGWVNDKADEAEIINLFLDYETFGEHQKADSGIFDFLSSLPEALINNTGFSFMTPSEMAKEFQPVSAIEISAPISWADEERDLTAWLGNDLQDAAFNKLYQLSNRIRNCNDKNLLKDWEYLQVSDHFYYMCTKFFSDGAVHAYFNPYESPYDAFMNYMNVLSDFEIRLNNACPEPGSDYEIRNLQLQLDEQNKLISNQQKEISKLRTKIKTQSSDKTADRNIAAKTKSAAAKSKATTRPAANKKTATGKSAAKSKSTLKRSTNTKK